MIGQINRCWHQSAMLLLLLAALVSSCSGAVETAPTTVEPSATAQQDVADLSDDQVVIDEDSPPPPEPEPDPVAPEPVAETVEASPSAPTTPGDEPTSETGVAIDPDAPFCERNRMEKQMAPLSPTVKDCAKVDRLVFYSRESQGRCGPIARMQISGGGKIVLERTAAACSGEKCCPAPLTAKKVIKAKRAKKIIADICANHSAAPLDNKPGCATSSTRFYFFKGKAKLSGTHALPCDGGPMKSSVEQIQKLLGMFD